MNAQRTGPVASEMLKRLEAALAPSRIELIDESELHHGHGGYNPAGESHFRLSIESPAFAGKNRVERQRMVYAALGELMDARVHALSIRATAPGRVSMATIESSIIQTITPVTHDLGAFQVRRALPHRERTMVGPFIFVDEFGPARLPAGQGMDVRPHPHINLATVTYLFEGAIEHRDSIGSHQVIEPGAINLMTAGKGIVHSERSPEALRPQGPSLYGMQTWLALPDGKEEVNPAFDHVPAGGLPLVEDGGATARVLMGTLWGATAATPCHSPTIYADIELGAGGSIPIDAEADERAVMVVGGEAELDGEPLESFTLYVLRPGHAARLSSASGARAMLMGGGAFATPRHVYWNFVSSSKDRLQQAREDWIERRFPLVPGDEEEFIPFPEVVRTVSYP